MPAAWQSTRGGTLAILNGPRSRADNRGVVSFSGGGGGAALGSPAGILVLLIVIAVVGLVWWLFNR